MIKSAIWAAIFALIVSALRYSPEPDYSDTENLLSAAIGFAAQWLLLFALMEIGRRVLLKGDDSGI